jgi:hypothetical protein
MSVRPVKNARDSIKNVSKTKKKVNEMKIHLCKSNKGKGCANNSASFGLLKKEGINNAKTLKKHTGTKNRNKPAIHKS